MFNKIRGIFRNKSADSTAFMIQKVKSLDGKTIRYVSERRNNVDEVVGRAGAFNIKGDEFVVMSSFDVVFRCKLEALSASDLMSLDGVVLQGPDLENGGKNRTIIAYYSYYR